MTRPDDETRADDASLRGLAGRGPSQVGISAAMRARDVSRPTKRQITDAEALDLDVASRAQQRTRRDRRPRPGERAGRRG